MRNSISILFLLISSLLWAQKPLTIEDAVSIALKNNYDIRLAQNSSDIAKINNTLGNAGMLPTLQIGGSGSYGSANVYQKLASGSENNYAPLATTALSAGIELDWTLFDGGKMFVTKSKLSEIQSLGALQFKDKVLQTQFEIVAVYYDLVKQQQQLKLINELINFNRERVKLTQTGVDAGYYMKSDLLQAKIDLNVSLENELAQKLVIGVVKRELNVLLGQKTNTEIEVTDSIPLNFTPDKANLLAQLNTTNTNILLSQKQLEIASLILKENATYFLPKVNFNAGYYISKTTNSVGNTLENKSNGPQLGGTLSIPLFNAGETKRKVSVARKELQSAELNLENVKLQVNSELETALSEFENQLLMLKFEKENYSFAKENLEISMQRLMHRQTTSLEVHQAQEFYVQSFTRLTNFEYNLKLSESKLKQLIATL